MGPRECTGVLLTPRAALQPLSPLSVSIPLVGHPRQALLGSMSRAEPVPGAGAQEERATSDSCSRPPQTYGRQGTAGQQRCKSRAGAHVAATVCSHNSGHLTPSAPQVQDVVPAPPWHRTRSQQRRTVTDIAAHSPRPRDTQVCPGRTTWLYLLGLHVLPWPMAKWELQACTP